jgi:hypothetical protein
MKKGRSYPAFFICGSNYLEAAGAGAEAAAVSAFFAFLAFFSFFAFGADASAEAAGADAAAEAAGAAGAAGAEAWPAANTEVANRPAIKAAIRFFIFNPLM